FDGLIATPVPVEDADAGAFLQEAPGRGGADSAGTARDQDPLPPQSAHPALLPTAKGPILVRNEDRNDVHPGTGPPRPSAPLPWPHDRAPATERVARAASAFGFLRREIPFAGERFDLHLQNATRHSDGARDRALRGRASQVAGPVRARPRLAAGG